MLPTDPRAEPEAAEIYGHMDVYVAAAKGTAAAAEMADTVAESKRLPHAGTASGLATRKKSTAPKGGPKKPKCNSWKDETWKQDLLGQRAS